MRIWKKLTGTKRLAKEREQFIAEAGCRREYENDPDFVGILSLYWDSALYHFYGIVDAISDFRENRRLRRSVR